MKIETSFYCGAHNGHVNTTSDHDSITSGYALDDDGKLVCYECCAKRDVEYMRNEGRITLYLSFEVDSRDTLGTVLGTQMYDTYRQVTRRLRTAKITNWPGSLEITVKYIKKGRHNFAGVRYDTWFIGPDNYLWHGVRYGDNTELVHCKRTKEKSCKDNACSIVKGWTK